MRKAVQGCLIFCLIAEVNMVNCLSLEALSSQKASGQAHRSGILGKRAVKYAKCLDLKKVAQNPF